MLIEDYRFLNSVVNSRELKNSKRVIEITELLNVSIIRTLPFEYIANLLPSFLSLWEKEGVFLYSDYDTSLSQMNNDINFDCNIIWMDWRLYMEKMNPRQAIDWLKTRLKSLNSKKPILINNWPSFWHLEENLFTSAVSIRGWIHELNYLLDNLKTEFINIEVIDIDLVASQIGMSSYDIRNDEISNYPFSNQFTIQIARHIALNLLPSVIAPRLKAIVVDLDNTLYGGILGEDGKENIILTEDHKKFQKTLRRLKESGILLAISSKNNKQDVLNMLDYRSDFPLKQEDFIFIEANWDSKIENIAMMAKKFNFEVSSILFIDDNPAEIVQANEYLPSLHTLLADKNGTETVNRLLNYPYLYTRNNDELSDLRQLDILANEKRKELKAASLNENDYLSTLQMKIVVYENELTHFQRIFEISHKTNQFNLALKRLDKAEILEKGKNDFYKLYTVELSDVLTDSGIIGVFICKIVSEKAIFEEILFSCRALNRKVEDRAFKLILENLILEGIRELEIESTIGPRNEPAINWMNSLYTSSNIDDIIRNLNRRLERYPAEVIWGNERNC